MRDCVRDLLFADLYWYREAVLVTPPHGMRILRAHYQEGGRNLRRPERHRSPCRAGPIATIARHASDALAMAARRDSHHHSIAAALERRRGHRTTRLRLARRPRAAAGPRAS